jgi:hypothetical protein
VLADHREQVAEQLALVGGQALGDLVERRRAAVARLIGADAGMTVPVRGRGGAALDLRYLCLPSLRNLRPLS